MPDSNRPGSGPQQPQSPFDLWRTTPSPGRPRFPLLWIILLLPLLGLFGSGFWLRPWDAARKQVERGAEAAMNPVMDAVQTPREPHVEAAERIIRENPNLFSAPPLGLVPAEVARREPPAAILDPETTRKVAQAELKRRQLDAKAGQRSVLAGGVKAREALARWKSGLDRWDSLSAKLLDGEEGRPVAGGDEFVRQFRTISQAERPSRVDYEQAREGLEQILGPIEQAVHDPNDLLQPGSEVVQSIDACATQATEAAARWKESLQEMSALAALARRRGLTAKITLRQAIDDLETGMAAERLKAKNAKLAEAEKQAAETDAAIEAEKITAPAESRKAQAQDARKKKLDQAERLRKRQLAHGDDVRRYLGSLMEKGFTQPEPWGNSATPKKVGEEGPVSLAALRASGCLEAGLAGQASLTNFMVHPRMDRTRWGMFSEHQLWKPDQQRFIIRAQQLLIEYGEAMVDEGLLAK